MYRIFDLRKFGEDFFCPSHLMHFILLSLIHEEHTNLWQYAHLRLPKYELHISHLVNIYYGKLRLIKGKYPLFAQIRFSHVRRVPFGHSSHLYPNSFNDFLGKNGRENHPFYGTLVINPILFQRTFDISSISLH